MSENLTHDDRRIVTVALRNHATALLKEAKKVQELGHEIMATDLRIESGRVTDHLIPQYDDQTTLALGSEEGGGEDDGEDQGAEAGETAGVSAS